MSRLRRLAAALAFTGLPLYAQEPDTTAARVDTTGKAGKGAKFGIGMSLNPAALVIFDEDQLAAFPGFNNFSIPIKTGERTYIEPEFGVFRTSVSTSGGGFSGDASFTNIRVGVGVLMEMQPRGDLRPYIGPRVGINRISSKTSGGGFEESSKQTNWFVSGVLGAQYFFSPHFSLGGEVQLTRTSIGNPTTEPPSTSEDKQSFITTQSLLLLRWYF